VHGIACRLQAEHFPDSAHGCPVNRHHRRRGRSPTFASRPERICGVPMVCDASEPAAVLQLNQSPRRQGAVVTATHDCATATRPLSAGRPGA
jgi:hypothetical protein